MSQEAYKGMLHLQRSNEIKFQDLKVVLTGKSVFPKLKDEFEYYCCQLKYSFTRINYLIKDT